MVIAIITPERKGVYQNRPMRLEMKVFINPLKIPL